MRISDWSSDVCSSDLASGVNAPRKAETAVPPRPSSGALAMPVTASIGDYRAGDLLWLERLAPDRFGDAINRDVLVPRPAGRFLFARLIGREEGKLHLLPLTSGARQTVVAAPPWIDRKSTRLNSSH